MYESIILVSVSLHVLEEMQKSFPGSPSRLYHADAEFYSPLSPETASLFSPIIFVNFRQNVLAAAPNNRVLCIGVIWNLIRNNRSFLDTFAHFLSNFITFERKKNTKNPVSCRYFVTDVSFVSWVERNTQGSLITGGRWNRYHFRCCDFLSASKSTIEILNVAKISQHVFRWWYPFMFAARNLCCFYVANFVADYVFFFNSRSTLPKNFLLLFLKTVYQYLFTFASMFVLHKAG